MDGWGERWSSALVVELLFERFEDQIPARAEIWFGVSAPSALTIANSAMMSTLTVHCQCQDETVRERTGNPPSYAEAKKMKSLTLHTYGCLRASLRNCSSTSTGWVMGG